jgi:hypothetical protein
MAGINKGVPWFGAALAAGILATVCYLSTQPGDPGDKAVRPVTDAVDAAGLLFNDPDQTGDECSNAGGDGFRNLRR